LRDWSRNWSEGAVGFSRNLGRGVADSDGVTAPREILPGRTYLLTRRCTQRLFLLRPDEETNAIFAYCLAEAATRFDIGLLAWLAMSNHYHAVVHDPKGRLPQFIEHLHKMLAKSLNVKLGRKENLWSTEETCLTYLPNPEDIVDKVVYVLANPLNEHLVDRVSHWPGCSSLEHMLGKQTVHERPAGFFSKNGRMPEVAQLQAIVPSTVSRGDSREHWSKRILDALATKERELQLEIARTGTRVLGRKGVLSMSPLASPTTPEDRSLLRPSLACKNPTDRKRHLQNLLAFYAAYEIARVEFVTGKHEVEFPAGTYRLRAWGARCAPFPAAA
jgi:REP element-mobilizing transposase RayT